MQRKCCGLWRSGGVRLWLLRMEDAYVRFSIVSVGLHPFLLMGGGLS